MLRVAMCRAGGVTMLGRHATETIAAHSIMSTRNRGRDAQKWEVRVQKEFFFSPKFNKSAKKSPTAQRGKVGAAKKSPHFLKLIKINIPPTHFAPKISHAREALSS